MTQNLCLTHGLIGPATFIGPTAGVIDGSNAPPGMVGEFVTGSTPVTYAGYPTMSDSVMTPLALPAGDWDVWTYADVTNTIGGLSIYLDPLPDGFSNTAAISTGALMTVMPLPPGRVPWVRTQSSLARASLTALTLLPFHVQVDQSYSSSLPAGSLTFTVEARRRR